MSAPNRVSGQAVERNVSGTSTTLTLPSNVTAGNLIILRISQLNTGGSNRPTNTPSDSLGNTYTKAVSAGTYGTDPVQEIWYARNIAGGACTITVTWNGGSDSKELFAEEITGADPSAPLDVTGSIINNTTATDQYNTAAGGVTTSANGAYVVTCYSSDSPLGTVTPDAGWARESLANANVVMLTQSSASSLSSTRAHFTVTSTRKDRGCLASFKAPAAAAGGLLRHPGMDGHSDRGAFSGGLSGGLSA